MQRAGRRPGPLAEHLEGMSAVMAAIRLLEAALEHERRVSPHVSVNSKNAA